MPAAYLNKPTSEWTPEEYADFYPDGRTFYDETDDTAAFIEACHAMDLCPAINFPPPERELEPFTTVYVPAHKLHAFYALGLRVGT